mmetsp:Transcript_1006/g.1474  ORF Transcript_1006/g.1474 Transcript_1006/m.1474 type:complete len:282 (+) Transcript_1006:331-1176(+)
MAAYGLIVAVAIVAAYMFRFWDLGQCTRSCRVEYGEGYPDVLGHTGGWAFPGIFGTRSFAETDKCFCFKTEIQKGTDKKVNNFIGKVDRYHNEIATKDQWWFITKQVCGSDGAEYDSAEKAHANGVSVLNCGQCGLCSTEQDTNALHIRSKNMTMIASGNALLYLALGEYAYNMFATSSIVGFSEGCAWCWLQATQCNIAHCARYCFFNWQNPLSTSSTKPGTVELNECMHCDEVFCSAYYLQSCGANRRTSGVVSDIDRPNRYVCTAAGADTRKRLGLND